jgi:cytochrome c oxidase subunit 2
MGRASNRYAPAARWAAVIALVMIAVVVTSCSGDSYPQSTLHPLSDETVAIDALYRQIFWWAVLVFVVVESALLFTLIRFRKRPGAGEPKQVHGHTLVEITWTLAPAAIIVAIAIPTIRTIFKVSGTAPPGALAVDVIGHQWWWEFRYPDLGITTANELHLPVGQPVALSLSSADVIHSFWAPRLSGKRDAMPGRTNRLAFTPDSIGTYHGQCAEYCGDSHANMRMRVMVTSPEDFQSWVAAQKATPAQPDSTQPLLAAGEAAFRKVRQPATHSCFACHTIAGISGGVVGPNLTHLASRTTIAAGMLPNDSADIARWLHDPAAVKPGSLMPTIDLTDQEIAALVAYLQSRN